MNFTKSFFSILFLIYILPHCNAQINFISSKLTQKIFSTSSQYNVFVNDIALCPPLTPRISPPANVHDLRPDDIKMIMALGDSITAGFLANAICDENNTTMKLHEYRGVSYAMGGDIGAVSIANFFKHYSPELKGASLGYHLVEVCYGVICPPKQYKPEQDQMNAAQSGSLAKNLDYQVEYLLRQFEKEPEEIKNSWKFLNVFIGSNDICLQCLKIIQKHETTFEDYVYDALEKIRTNIPNVIVNIVGNFNVSQIYKVTRGQTKYCKKLGVLPNFECECAFLESPEGDKKRQNMDDLSQKYNAAINRIVQNYADHPSDTFAVVYQPFDLDLMSFPIDALSCADCFHPSLKLHEHSAKLLWNNFIIPSKSRYDPVKWDPLKKIRCWNDDDRIATF
ncbi:11190_t:CDS:2 [Gigaspora margarita]|uniref:11190_t:CDS:1 n=1 Tax=Gigaspora margarita TaxID=4874 RepID=A0ABN7UEC2_GIGMA|nr:11190_t:CDS:2 [Gigaspora margarita]